MVNLYGLIQRFLRSERLFFISNEDAQLNGYDYYFLDLL